MDWQGADPDDYESGKEWEWHASTQAMFSLKDDLEPLPLLNPNGQQVGIGIGLFWWNGVEGELRGEWTDESWPSDCCEPDRFTSDDDDDRLFSDCPEDFQLFSARDDE